MVEIVLISKKCPLGGGGAECGWCLCIGGWSGDSGKTLEVTHPVGLALDADSAVALALEDVRSLCVNVCVC